MPKVTYRQYAPFGAPCLILNNTGEPKSGAIFVDLFYSATPLIVNKTVTSMVDLINAELVGDVDKEIMVYVHGTKVDFAYSAILTAEIDYFTGRDFVGLAFAWPSHQNILYYLSDIDVRRALNSSASLQSLLVLLSEHTTAKHINILSYSAGGKVASKALFEMRQTFSKLDEQRHHFFNENRPPPFSQGALPC